MSKRVSNKNVRVRKHRTARSGVKYGFWTRRRMDREQEARVKAGVKLEMPI